MTLKIIVAGGRDLRDFGFVCRNLDTSIETIKGLFPNYDVDDIEIVSGHQKSHDYGKPDIFYGADYLGEKYAFDKEYNIKLFPADWNNLDAVPCKVKYRGDIAYNVLAGFNRNDQMAEYAHACIVFWDGRSPGSKHMIKACSKVGIQCLIVPYTDKEV